MKTFRFGLGLTALCALSACAVPPPSGPTVAAMPGQGKTYEQFQADDGLCRQSASAMSGGPGAAQAATNNAVGTAAVGTVLGAAAGALIGSASGNVGAGAAIGAGAGLIGGSAVGASGAQASAGDLQAQYDTAYTQCMFAKGNTVQRPGIPLYPAPVYAAPVYPAPYPYYYRPRPYYPY